MDKPHMYNTIDNKPPLDHKLSHYDYTYVHLGGYKVMLMICPVFLNGNGEEYQIMGVGVSYKLN